MSLDYRIGTTKAGIVTLASLNIVDPQPIPVQFAEVIPTGDGGQRGVGFLQCEWRWAHLSSADIAALRVFCPEPAMSAAVWIKTVKSGGGMDVYSATLWWPQIEPASRDTDFEDFVIFFNDLVHESST